MSWTAPKTRKKYAVAWKRTKATHARTQRSPARPAIARRNGRSDAGHPKHHADRRIKTANVLLTAPGNVATTPMPAVPNPNSLAPGQGRANAVYGLMRG